LSKDEFNLNLHFYYWTGWRFNNRYPYSVFKERDYNECRVQSYECRIWDQWSVSFRTLNF